MADQQPAQKKSRLRVATCYGCRAEIFDQYILQVAPDMEWHAQCLKCAECQQFLDENCTCFVKEKKTYCKRDYMRLFAAKCAKCSESFNKNDFVMRARNKIYHPDCFCCESCSRPLVSGDEFALRDEHLFCKVCTPSRCPLMSAADSQNDHEVIEKGHFLQELSPEAGSSISPMSNSNSSSLSATGSTSGGSKLRLSAEPMQPSNRHRDSVRHGHKQNSEHKPTRVRTVLNEKQLNTLRNCYNANPRPDALMKEQLVEMTGLSPRVIRVWFQNKRCKDKKRMILTKQMEQQAKFRFTSCLMSDSDYTPLSSPDGRQLQNIVNMRGVPLVASSPVQHDSPVQHPIEVQSYRPPWKAFADYALHHDLDPSAPHFQHLVNQMHGYDVGLPPGPPPPADPHLVPLPTGPCTPLSFLPEHELHNPHSNLSSHVPGTPSEMSSPCASD